MLNINTQEYWDDIYIAEYDNPWRINSVGFSKISAVVGTCKRVLDVGCGQGILLDKLKENGNATCGLDISIEGLKQSVDKGHTVIHGNIETFDFKDFEKFDIIILSHILEHLDKDHEVIQKCKNLLRKNGKIIGLVPNNVLSVETEPSHVRVYNKNSLMELLGNCFIEEFIEEFYHTKWGYLQKDSSPCLFFVWEDQLEEIN
jgi:2-polyprenyl-3-methyl-5-hydroxy-6-metoxy-1,4-benzoquinol methylase